MINFIYTHLILPMFRKIIETNQHRYHLAQSAEEREKLSKTREELTRKELHNRICISVGEGSTNLVVGKTVDWLDSVPIIEDVVSGNRLICFGITMQYSEENLQALYRLDPNQRYGLLAKLPKPRKPKTTDSSEQVPIEFILEQVREKYDPEKDTSGDPTPE